MLNIWLQLCGCCPPNWLLRIAPRLLRFLRALLVHPDVVQIYLMGVICIHAIIDWVHIQRVVVLRGSLYILKKRVMFKVTYLLLGLSLASL